MPYLNSLSYVSGKLGVDPWLLDSIIKFESGGNPRAVSADGQAFGLIQFRDSTARSMGYSSGRELIATHPTYDSQIINAVLPYMMRYAPHFTVQGVCMSVFYPAYRFWYIPEFWPFPAIVRKNNVAISNPLDYINRVYKVGKRMYIPKFLIAGVPILWVTMAKTMG